MYLKIIFVLQFLFFSLLCSGAPDTSRWAKGPSRSWHLTLESAQEAAREKGRKIYVLITGSDWCGFCVKLQKEVLSAGRFRSLAGKNFELVYIDLPRRKKMPAEQRKYNTALAGRLGDGGYPRAFILDADGKKLGKIRGYRSLGRYLAELRKFAGDGSVSPARSARRTSQSLSAGVSAPPSGWHTSLEKALEQAKKSNKNVFVLKTGSDWCPPCRKMGREVFYAGEFRKFAADNLELVYLDLPRRKKISSRQRRYNQQTAHDLKMSGGVPSYAVLDSSGNVLSRRAGYGNLKNFMDYLKKEAAASRVRSSSAAASEEEKPASAGTAQEKKNSKTAELLLDAQVQLLKWGSTYNDASAGLGEIPRSLSAGKRIFIKVSYDLPEGLRGCILIRCRGKKQSFTGVSRVVSGQGTTIVSGRFNEAFHHRELQISFFQRSEKKVYPLQTIPCSINVK